MASEAKRGLIRIVANYVRVFTVIFLGLLIVRLLLKGTGNEGWALIALLGSTIGLGSMLQRVMRSGLIRELGEAYHSGRPDHFRNVYNSALAVSAVLAVLAVGVFTVLWFVIPLFRIPPELLSAARWLVVARGLETFAGVLLAAPFNMYKVTERMVAYNAWLIVTRLCYVIAATLVMVPGIDDPGRGITLYALISASLVVLTLLAAAGVMMGIDRRLIPAPATASREGIKTVLHIGGWNAGATIVTALHRHLAPLIMNLAFGLPGNLILGLAIQLTVAVRRLGAGMSEGLDAVSARLSTAQSTGAIRMLIHHSTRLHGFATFPVAVGVVLLAEPVLRLWVGDRLEDPETTLPLAITLIRIMTVGMVARAISDGWIRILYGAGHVARYAPCVLAGGVLNPLLAVVLLVVLPESVRYTAVCWAFSAVLVVIHGALVPLIGARALQTGYGHFFTPLVRPLVIALACSPILVLTSRHLQEWTWLRLVATIGAYSAMYTVGCIMFAMDRPERLRFARAALRRLPIPRKGEQEAMK